MACSNRHARRVGGRASLRFGLVLRAHARDRARPGDPPQADAVCLQRSARGSSACVRPGSCHTSASTTDSAGPPFDAHPGAHRGNRRSRRRDHGGDGARRRAHPRAALARASSLSCTWVLHRRGFGNRLYGRSPSRDPGAELDLAYVLGHVRIELHGEAGLVQQVSTTALHAATPASGPRHQATCGRSGFRREPMRSRAAPGSSRTGTAQRGPSRALLLLRVSPSPPRTPRYGVAARTTSGLRGARRGRPRALSFTGTGRRGRTPRWPTYPGRGRVGGAARTTCGCGGTSSGARPSR